MRLAFVLLAAIATPASAASTLVQKLLEQHGGNTCWERSYDAAHLKAHPMQQVVHIRLSSEVMDDGSFSAALGVTLRKRTSKSAFDYTLPATCATTGKAMACDAEWEAGRFTLEAAPGGGLRVRHGRLVVNPANYDAEEIAPGAVDLSKSDDAVWLLTRMADGNCTVF